MRDNEREQSVGRRAVGGLGWTVLGAGGQALLQVGVLAILARLISPRDFGVIAAALVAVGLSTILAEGGIGPAVVQRQRIDERHIRVGLTFQIGAAAAIWLALVLASRPIATLFGIEALQSVLPAIAIVLVIRSLTLGDYLMQRALEFRALALLELVSYLVGYGLLAVTLALKGYGVWAIVAGHLGQTSTRTILLWFRKPHSARPLWDWSALRELLFFGGGYTLAWWANYMARNGDDFVVGRFLGAAALGLYSRAYNLMKLPALLFGNALNQVLFPAMAAIQEEREKLRRAYLLGVGLIAGVALPLSALLAVASREVIVILLGESWLRMTAALDVMIFGMLFRTGYNVSDCLAKATGAVYRRAWRQGVYATFVIGGAVVGQVWGLRGVAFGLLSALTINYVLMAQLSLRIIQTPWRAFFEAHVPGVVMGAAAGLGAQGAAVVLRAAEMGPAAVLIASSAAAAISAVALARLIARLAALGVLMDLASELMRFVDNRRLRRLLLVLLGPRLRRAVSGPLGVR